MSTDLVTQEQNYGLMLADDMREMIEENLGGAVDVGQLERVKMPAGGGKLWSIPTLEGEVDQREIEGVIVYMRYQNAYWSRPMEEAGDDKNPDCSSNDAKIGYGEPGGECIACPLNQFGSGNDGKGKACKNMVSLFILQKGNILPIIVTLPPTSLKRARKYMMQLTQSGASYSSVLTKITLEKDKNDNNIEYSLAVFEAVNINPDGATPAARVQFDTETIGKIKGYRSAMIPELNKAPIEE